MDENYNNYNNYGNENTQGEPFTQPSYNNNGRNQSLAVLILGSVSLGLQLMCCVGGAISIVCGIIGLVLGIPLFKKDPQDIQVKLGVIFSAVGIGIAILSTIAAIVISITGALGSGALGDIIYNHRLYY